MNQIIMGQFEHWHPTQDQNQIVWLTLDRKDKSVNTFNEDVMRELDQILTSLAQNDTAKAIIFRSGKPSVFIAGADIEQFDTFSNAEEATKKRRTFSTRFLNTMDGINDLLLKNPILKSFDAVSMRLYARLYAVQSPLNFTNSINKIYHVCEKGKRNHA